MKKRFKALYIDYMLLLLIYIPLYYLWSENVKEYDFTFDICFLLLCLTFMFKDLVFKNASIGKKIVGLEIVTVSNKKAKTLKLILRNITIFIWPIELILMLSKKERLGDRLFHTKVIEVNGKK